MRQTQGPESEIRSSVGHCSQHKLNGFNKLMNHGISNAEGMPLLLLLEQRHEILFIRVCCQLLDCLLLLLVSTFLWLCRKVYLYGSQLYASFRWLYLLGWWTAHLRHLKVSSVDFFKSHLHIVILLEDQGLRKEHPWWTYQNQDKNYFADCFLASDYGSLFFRVYDVSLIKEQLNHNVYDRWSLGLQVTSFPVCEPFFNNKEVHEAKKS